MRGREGVGGQEEMIFRGQRVLPFFLSFFLSFFFFFSSSRKRKKGDGGGGKRGTELPSKRNI